MKFRNVVLMRDGFYGERYDESKKEIASEKIKDTKELIIANWESDFEIRGLVTFQNFVEFLESMRADDLTLLSIMTNSNIDRFVDDFRKNRESIVEDDSLTHIEIYRSLELSNYEMKKDEFNITDYTSATGIGKAWGDVPECNSYALEWTPWQKLLHLPLVLRKHVSFSEELWVKTSKKTKFANTDYTVDSKIDQIVRKKVVAKYSLREFMLGIFNELCFFKSPEHRDSENEQMKSMADEVEEELKNLEADKT